MTTGIQVDKRETGSARARCGHRPRVGRPTAEQARARHEALLEAALDQFLEKGFELATIDTIAASVRMTKRTVYARYPDKAALFHAAVGLAIRRFTVPQASIEATDSGNIEQSLVALAWLRVDQVLSPNGLKLQRILNAESYRFPQLPLDSFEQSGRPTARFLARLFERENAAGRLALTDPEKAAELFLGMVVGGPVRAIVLGQAPERAELDERIRFGVRLFLDGARARATPARSSAR